MTRATKAHLDVVSYEDLLKFQAKTFILYASSNGVSLSFNGLQRFKISVSGKEDVITESLTDALDLYIAEVEEND